MSNPNSDIDRFIESVRTRFETGLERLVNIPTVSADPARAGDMRRGAAAAAELITTAGLKAEVVPTAGHPVVFGRLVQDPSFRTVTVYNHLDVQPADPADWDTPPFELTKRGSRYIGRGATDDKGPALTALTAIHYALTHKIPLNFNVIWELEEEIGSPHFDDFMTAKRDQLTTNSVVISDTIWISSDKPAIPVGLRGLMTFELALRTAAKDTHSGLAGGAARNPLGELAQMISECYDAKTGHVTIPGFYDDVQPPSDSELQNFIDSGFSTKQFMADHELSSLRRGDTKTTMARIMAEPTFEVHGLGGGYDGPGVKTVVPAAATAKLSTRLVPNQDPERIFGLIKAFINSRNPDIKVTMEAGLEPYLSPLAGPHAKAAAAAVRAAFGTEPAFVREGGSIGAAIAFKRRLDVPIMFLGLSLPEHGYHAPNEHYDWGQAAGGIKMFAYYFDALAKLPAA